jgi:hypothetical protein
MVRFSLESFFRTSQVSRLWRRDRVQKIEALASPSAVVQIGGSRINLYAAATGYRQAPSFQLTMRLHNLTAIDRFFLATVLY